MKKILLLGGSHRDIPLIKAAQVLGYFVITLGDRDFYKGHSYADKYYKIDFNDLDAVKKIIKKEHITYLIPGCGEASYLSTVKLANELYIGNFDSDAVAQLVHNKWQFKVFCLAHNISTPKGLFFTDDTDDLSALNFPLVVKPTNLSAGQGVMRVSNTKELHNALAKAKTLSNEIFLEEFIEGELYAYSIIFKNQKIAYAFEGKDDSYLNPYLVSSAYSSKFTNLVREKLTKDIEKLAKLLPLVDGMFHLQIIIKKDVPYIIDVTRRIPGELYPMLIEMSDNISYSKSVIQSYTTGNIIENLTSSNETFTIRHVVMPNKNGVYEKLFIDESLKNNITFLFELEEEQTMIDDYLHAQLAIIFITLAKKDPTIINNINKLIYPIIS